MRVTDSEALGRLVRQRRIDLGLSQSELAERIGSTRQWLSRFEQGSNDASITRALAACRALGLALDARPEAASPSSSLMPQYAALSDALVEVHRRIQRNAEAATKSISSESMQRTLDSFRKTLVTVRQPQQTEQPDETRRHDAAHR